MLDNEFSTENINALFADVVTENNGLGDYTALV